MTDGPDGPATTNHLIIIAEWTDESSNQIRVQNFLEDGESYIPVFSSKAMFDELVAGSPYHEKGISMEIDMLFSILGGDETLILNPGSAAPWIMRRKPARVGPAG